MLSHPALSQTCRMLRARHRARNFLPRVRPSPFHPPGRSGLGGSSAAGTNLRPEPPSPPGSVHPISQPHHLPYRREAPAETSLAPAPTPVVWHCPVCPALTPQRLALPLPSAAVRSRLGPYPPPHRLQLRTPIPLRHRAGLGAPSKERSDTPPAAPRPISASLRPSAPTAGNRLRKRLSQSALRSVPSPRPIGPRRGGAGGAARTWRPRPG